jgi:hypothetical protein
MHETTIHLYGRCDCHESRASSLLTPLLVPLLLTAANHTRDRCQSPQTNSRYALPHLVGETHSLGIVLDVHMQSSKSHEDDLRCLWRSSSRMWRCQRHVRHGVDPRTDASSMNESSSAKVEARFTLNSRGEWNASLNGAKRHEEGIRQRQDVLG